MNVLTSARPRSARRRRLVRAAPRPLPDAVSPMLCKLTDLPFDRPGWIFEPKYDGLRVLSRLDGLDIKMLSRLGNPQDQQFPEISRALQKSLKHRAWVDGEIVCLDEEGRSSFHALQQRMHLLDRGVVAAHVQRYPAYLYLFDILYVDRFDLKAELLEERKEILRSAVRWSNLVRWTPAVAEQGIAAWQEACATGREGVVGKKLDSPYVSRRSGWWLKIKCTGRQEFVIGGYTDPQGSRIGLGALLVGYYSDDGKYLCYAGKVGTGFSDRTLSSLMQELAKLEQSRSPFAVGDPPRGPGVHWVRPVLVAEVTFAEWTPHGRLRQPRFEGLRADKRPRECRRERP